MTEPKVRRAQLPSLSAAQGSSEVAAPHFGTEGNTASGHEVESSFERHRRSLAEYAEGVGDPSEGRKARGGVADDSVGRIVRGGAAAEAWGRKPKGGVADDSVGRKPKGGVADDSVGRKPNGGVADDSVGRKPNGGVADDSVGRKPNGGVADDSVGRKPKGGVADDSVGRKPNGGVADDSVGLEVGPAEDPAQLALREALFARMERPRYLDTAEAKPTSPVNMELLRHDLQSAVAPSRLKGLWETASKDPVAASRLAIVLESTDVLPPATRTQLLELMADSGPRSAAARVVEKVTTSQVWQRLTNSQKVALAEVMAAGTQNSLLHLGAFLENAPSKLLEQDTNGRTLLSNLHQLAEQPLHTSLYGQNTSAQVLEAVLRDLANPNRIDQGTTTTCTVTSMQWELANENRAEYVRLIAGLCGPEGRAVMRGGGTLRATPDDGLLVARHGRSVSSALFQSAAIEYANGRDDFDPVKGRSTRYDHSRIYGGLNPDQQTRLLEQLFGVKYSSDNLQSEAEGARALESLRGFDTIGSPNRPILLAIDQGKVNHTVTLERIRDGRVFFRDPYGELRSMPEGLFAKVVVGVHRPALG